MTAKITELGEIIEWDFVKMASGLGEIPTILIYTETGRDDKK